MALVYSHSEVYQCWNITN